MTTQQAADILGIRRETVAAYCLEGKLRATRVGKFQRTWEIPAAEVERLRAHEGRTKPAMYERMIELGQSTTQRRLEYAIRRLCDLLDDEQWLLHVAYVAKKTATKRR